MEYFGRGGGGGRGGSGRGGGGGGFHGGHGNRWFGPSRPYYGGLYGGGYPVYSYLDDPYYTTSNVCIPVTGREVCPLEAPVKRSYVVNGYRVWRCCDY